MKRTHPSDGFVEKKTKKSKTKEEQKNLFDVIPYSLAIRKPLDHNIQFPSNTSATDTRSISDGTAMFFVYYNGKFYIEY